VQFNFNMQTGVAQWYFKGTDPYTGLLADFLPPNTNTVDPRGRGWVSYSVKPKSNLPTGTVIKNKATIDFEVGVPPDPMDTPEVFNTIDSGAPSSSVSPLSATQNALNFTVSWSGNDDPGGSGIRNYDIYVSDNSGPYTLWATIPETSAIFTGEYGHQYSFYSRARDNVGNIEDAPTSADATTRITPLQPPTAEAGGPYTGDVGSPITFDASGSSDPYGSIVRYEWDWNDDGIYEESTASAAISHTWSVPYAGNIRLRVKDNDGLTAIDTASVDIKPLSFRVSGGAYFYPEAPTYRASFSMDVTGPSSPSGWLKYYYARTRMNFVSTGITSVSASGNMATISGTGTVNGVGGYTFTATVTNGSPDTFAIVIKKSDGTTYYSAGPKNISGGDLLIQ